MTQGISELQAYVVQRIIEYGKEHNLNESETSIALRFAYIESKFNVHIYNSGTQAMGLFQYLARYWNAEKFGNILDIDSQMKAYSEDIKEYELHYNQLSARQKDTISLGEYAYVLHNHGRYNKEGQWMTFEDIQNQKILRNKWHGSRTEIDSWIKNYERNIKLPPSTVNSLLKVVTNIFDLVSSAEAATDPPVRRDPLILDLNGDGIKTNQMGTGTNFDHDANGFAEQTGWADPNDGLLVLDRNGDGIINDGKELFGDQTILANGQKAANGFQALAELDANGDGKIDASDAAYTQLRVWRDEDGDGYSLPEELHTLEELGISSINVTAQATNVPDEQGNVLNALGSFQWSDGTVGQIGSYGLQRDTLHTVATEWLEVPEDIATLPYLQGSGNVYDLDQAMVRDASGTLKGLVEQFIASNDVSSRNSLMDQILFKWTGSDGLDPATRGARFI